MTKTVKLDEFDRAILDIVQQDSSLTHQAIGEQVHLSPSSVRRRLASLRSSGCIEREVAIVSPEITGVTLIVTLSFKEESPAAYDALDRRLQADSWVKQVYYVSGDDDYVIIVHAPSLEAFEDWGRRALMSDPAIGRYSTKVVWRRPKFDLSVSFSGD